MSWEFERCPECGGLMDRTSADKDDTGRIQMVFTCPGDGAHATVAEPDDNYRSRMELAAKEAAQ